LNTTKSKRKLPDDFLKLSHQILFSANKGLLRIDFLQEVAKIILNFSKCDVIELWIKETKNHLRNKIIRIYKETFQFEIIPFLKINDNEHNHVKYEDSELGKLCNDILHSHYDPASHFFTKNEIELYEGIVPIIGVALMNQSTQTALTERVKELTCLYGIAKVAEQFDSSLHKIIQGIVNLLPPAWQYPEITCAKIVLDGCSFTTPYFQESYQKQTADIVINGEKRGVVKVVYTKEKPALNEGPFLSEERSLIDTAAKQIALIMIN